MHLGPVSLPMERHDRGWWTAEVSDAGHGTGYAFSVDDGPARPDPRSRWQPDGVHAPSAVYEHARFAWTDQAWRGVGLAGAVAYELHVGTFTAAGTFDAAIERLDHLVDLGVTLVELMPVAAFDGEHGWGYDGVALFAPHEPYGGPDGLKRLVDACHARGLGVCLDVVYNHLGPSGNYLAEFGAVLHRQALDALGQCGQPRRRRLGRSAALRDRQRARLVPRLPPRRAAGRCRARAARRTRGAHPRGAVGGDRRGLGRARPAAVADRRERPQRPADGDAARGGRVRGPTRSGTTTCTTLCTRCSPANATGTTATSDPLPAWRKC